jgi:CBS domain-containing protein
MKAADVMTSNVITVGPDTSVAEIANVLLANRISAVPVVGETGELIGIVSEGDLIRRTEIDTDRHRSWWLGLVVGNTALAAEYVKSHGRKAADIMTRQVITAAPETPLRDIAALLEKNGIKRVPIVHRNKLAGIVSRANLVQALAVRSDNPKSSRTIDDSSIREEIIARLDGQAWSAKWPLNVIVHDGMVDLWGAVDSETVKEAVRVAVESTPGVCGINDNLVVYRPSSYV